MKAALAALLYTAALLWACAGENAVPASVDVCTLVERPATFDGKLVTARVFVESDGMHSTRLIDPACPKRSLAMTWEAADRNVRIRELIDTIFSNEHPGTLDKEVTVTVTGVFRSGDVARLELLDVRDVVVKRRASSPFDLPR